eukprot:TRINITY_DN10138_c0_g1_i10.p1 TRINITY_DN10138_c0_g1~~TRINITY_DN10138_c0_g1_i10.p1  ORF type:complete len:425 (-),score=42.38 TRINITY_DN10138_c0_g1_i10:155-1429(-)
MRSLQSERRTDAGDTAWVLLASSMAMLMLPALGFFHAGLLRRKNILHTIVQCFATFGTVSIVWSLFGYSLVFGESKGHFIGGSNHFVLMDINKEPYVSAPRVPGIAYFFFQLCGCAVASGLVVGAAAERLALFPSMIFSCVWALIVYCPVAHWVLHEEGWLKKEGAKDFAGGLNLHLNAGFSAMILAIVTGRRKESGAKGVSGKHNVSFTILGGALLWFGWLGYSGGAASAANYHAAFAIVNTSLAAATGAIGWTALDYFYSKTIKATGIVAGATCGLVSISCGCGFCPLWSSLLIGIIGALISRLVLHFIQVKHLFDDAADVFARHGISGVWGAFATGLWASDDTPGLIDGAFYGGGSLLAYQIYGILAIAGYSTVVTLTIGLVMKVLGILRVVDEEKGLDLIIYDEEAYAMSAELSEAPKIK